MNQLAGVCSALAAQQQRLLERCGLRLDRAVALLVSPQQRLRQQSDRLQALKTRLARAAMHPGERHSSRLAAARARLAQAQPRLEGLHKQLDAQRRHLADATVRQIERRRQRLDDAVQTLEALRQLGRASGKEGVVRYV